MTNAALVTGSTSGIGKAFAEKLAKERNNLVLVSRNETKLKKQADALSCKYGIAILIIPCDLSTSNAAELIYSKVSDEGIIIDILINNAGFNECGPFIETDGLKEITMIHLHVQHITEMMKLFVRDMVSAGNGRILNVGSTGSYMACPNDSVYAATKAYILSLSKGIHAELKDTGVTVTTLCPGSTRTEFSDKAGISDTLLFKLFVMEPTRVAEIGYKTMMKGKQSVIAGLYNKLLVFLSKIFPSAILNPIIKKMLERP